MASTSAQPASGQAPEPTAVTRISVITPMLNEAEHVDSFLADLAAQDFRGETEVLVADGGSTDGSAERLEQAAEGTGLDVTSFATQPGGFRMA